MLKNNTPYVSRNFLLTFIPGMTHANQGSIYFLITYLRIYGRPHKSIKVYYCCTENYASVKHRIKQFKTKNNKLTF